MEDLQMKKRIKNWPGIIVMVLCLALILACPGYSQNIQQQPQHETQKYIWLDELGAENALEGWGETNANKSIDGNPLTISGQKYDRGLGTHAPASYRIKLDGKARRFTAMVGIDDEIISDKHDYYKNALVEFLIISYNKNTTPRNRVLWQSGPMKVNEPAKKVNVNLEGVTLLKLIVTDGGNGINYDHADWADAKIEYAAAKPQPVKPYVSKPYILTPLPGPEPRINGARIFGVRPGSPFLFTIAATGKRPITFSAKGLPEGLELNSKTGFIRGVIAKKDTYYVTLIATNDVGSAERDFRIVVGDEICLTPPMGWNSWNCWGCSVTEEHIRASARAMVDKGLINHGWTYINIDDCWMIKPGDDPVVGGKARDDNGMPRSNKKFPDMKALTDYIHSLGLKAGIYTSPGPYTCQEFVGSYGYEAQDAKQFAEWGFDYLKYDWCYYSKIAKDRSLNELKKPYLIMRDELLKQKRDIVYSLCQYGMGEVWKWGEEVGGNCWRTTGDIIDTWGSMSSIGFSQGKCSPYAKPGHWNDPDMLVVGNVGWGENLHPSRLTPDEQYTHISLWCLLCAPLLIGCPIEQLDDFTLNLLTNDEVLEINQDPLGDQANPLVVEEEFQVWAKQMEDGSLAVGLFNMDGYEHNIIKIEWSQLGIKGRHRVRDLWRQKDLGIFNNHFEAKVPPHGVVLVRMVKN